MKKIMHIILVLSLVLIAMPTFAAVTSDNDGSADAVLTLTAQGGDDFDIALSPNVLAQYTVGINASGAALQWWAAGTVHSGGEYTYATAANVTKLYKKKNDGDNRLDEIPQTLNSESVWSDELWEL